ncbi:transcription elongation factor Spt5 [Candidatus Micrarchaeota archaeon RBG_16_49_10]|nr:MAG: transcription elongation factor Spt5 [Candidatus Micrarchaeota archaeon RBG_16_49_10]
MIYSVKTIIGRENVVIEAIANKAKVTSLPIKAIVHPEEIKGYIFVEAELKDVEAAIRDIPHARGIIRTPLPVEELKKFLKPKEIEIKLADGDIIEVIGGPFKGEKGKVKKFVKEKNEVTIELIEVTVPIPVTVNAGLVKVIDAIKKEE